MYMVGIDVLFCKRNRGLRKVVLGSVAIVCSYLYFKRSFFFPECLSMKTVINIFSAEVTLFLSIMDVHLNSSHSRLRDGNSETYIMNTESCTTVSGHQNNGVGTECESKLSMNSDDLSNDLREKLRIACCGSGGLINGCSKSLYDDIKNVDVTVNGLSNCHNLDLINSRVDCSNRLLPHLQNKEENENPQTTVTKAKSVVNVDCVKPVIEEISGEISVRVDSEPNTLSNSCGDENITYVGYESEVQMPDIMRLIQKDLSEPYSIYTYRYFIHNWPKLCFLAHDNDNCVGAIVCKLDLHKKHSRRGYIAMLAVDEGYRKRKIGSNLVLKAIKAMVQDNADEVVLETEITNKPALRLYENLGFVRDKRLFRYYLNGVDALRLKLWLR